MKALSELIEDFLSDQDINALSRKTYKLAVTNFTRWVVVRGIRWTELKKKDIINYKSDLLKDHKSLYTVDLYLTVVRRLFKWLEDQGLVDNVAAGVRSPRKEKKYRRGYLTVEQIDKLLSGIDRDTIVGKRDYAIIMMMLGAGLRRVEVSRMSVCDVDPDRMIVKLQRKGHSEKDTDLCMSDQMLSAIHDYLSVRTGWDDDSPLFAIHVKYLEGRRMMPASISEMVAKRYEKAGIDSHRMTCHSLRHTAAVQALKAGASLYDVQQMLGHTDIKTTTIYLKSIEAETRVNNRAVHLLADVLAESKREAKTDVFCGSKYGANQ